MTHANYLVWAFSFLPTTILVCSAVVDRKRSLLSPFWPLIFPVFVGTVLKIGMAQASGDARVTQAFEGLSTNDILMSLILISVFFLITALIYFLLLPGSSNPAGVRQNLVSSVRLDSRAVLLVSVIVLACSLFSLYLLLKASGSSLASITDFSGKRSVLEDSGIVSSGGIYRVFLNLAHVNTVLLVTFLFCCRGSRRDLLLWTGVILGVVVTFICCVGVSSRSSLVLLLIPTVGILKIEKLITWSHLVILVVGALLFANALVILRPRGDSQQTLTLVEIIKRSNEIPVGMTAVTNGTDVTKITRIRKHIDRSSDYYYGKTLILWPVMMLPKTFFPNKPEVPLGLYISRQVYGGEPGVDMGSIPPSLVGECYMNGGWIGVLAGAAIYGAGLKFLVVWLFPYRNTALFTVFLFLCALPLFTYFINMGDFSSSMVRLGLDVVSGGALLYIYRFTALRATRLTAFAAFEMDSVESDMQG